MNVLASVAAAQPSTSRDTATAKDLKGAAKRVRASRDVPRIGKGLQQDVVDAALRASWLVGDWQPHPCLNGWTVRMFVRGDNNVTSTNAGHVYVEVRRHDARLRSFQQARQHLAPPYDQEKYRAYVFPVPSESLRVEANLVWMLSNLHKVQGSK